MNRERKFYYRLAAILLAVICSAMLFPKPADAAVKLNRTSITLARYHSCRLKLTGTKKKVTWKSADTKIVTVDKNGRLIGMDKGSTVVTATAGKKKYKCRIKVVEYDQKLTLAAYGYKALSKTVPDASTLEINSVRAGSNISNVDFASFDCTFKDKSGEKKHGYVYVYRNQSASPAYYNITTEFYDEFLVMKFDEYPLSAIDQHRSEVLPLKSVKDAASVIFKLESIKIKEGEHFRENNTWLEL